MAGWTLDDVLFRLVHDRTYREHLLHRDRAALALPEPLLAEVLRLDTLELGRQARRALVAVRDGSEILGPGIAAAFPQTTARWARAMGDGQLLELMELFLASRPYADWARSRGPDAPQLVEEAFARFCVQLGCFDPACLQAELAAVQDGERLAAK
ncbi:MAG: hypothetical protein H6734_24520 [Alphaproteobacteria bacterium]|nr:hypothetical protein [Alphaproteobacteria bacterium]